MTAPFEIKGWCPSAHRPMLSGDGWVVRVKPRGGRLSAAQGAGIADLSRGFGNGLLDISQRANLQIRGVTEAGHPALLEGLAALGLLDAFEAAERRRNVIVTPFHAPDDGVAAMAQRLEEALCDVNAPDLPGKFGFAVDAGGTLGDAPADIRLDRDAAGWTVSANGAQEGTRAADPVATALALARWFLASGGAEAGRMARHLVAGPPLPDQFLGTPPGPTATRPTPGPTPDGYLAAFAFGTCPAETFGALGALRLTPWRMVLIEGARTAPDLPGLLTNPDDPLLRVIACTGAPGCAQAMGPTRTIARTLAGSVPHGAVLHVSGCAKGCAHSRPADLLAVAARGGYRLGAGRCADEVTGPVVAPADLLEALQHRIGTP